MKFAIHTFQKIKIFREVKQLNVLIIRNITFVSLAFVFTDFLVTIKWLRTIKAIFTFDCDPRFRCLLDNSTTTSSWVKISPELIDYCTIDEQNVPLISDENIEK